MPTQEQLFISCLFTTIVVALVVIPFFSRVFGVYYDYKSGKEEGVVSGFFWAIAVHIIIVVSLIATIKMWDLIIGDSLPEFLLQGSGGLFDIFWSDCGNLSSDSEIVNSLNAYRCIFFTFFEFILSLVIGLSPFIFFVLAFMVTSPNKRQMQEKSNDIVSRLFRAIIYTMVLMVALRLYLLTMNEVIFYKGGAKTVYDMSKEYWKTILLKT